MPKKSIKSQKVKKKQNEEEMDIDPASEVSDDFDPFEAGEEEPEEELDPEVAAALKLKKKQKKAPQSSSGVDYIPELERDDVGLDFDDLE